MRVSGPAPPAAGPHPWARPCAAKAPGEAPPLDRIYLGTAETASPGEITVAAPDFLAV